MQMSTFIFETSLGRRASVLHGNLELVHLNAIRSELIAQVLHNVGIESGLAGEDPRVLELVKAEEHFAGVDQSVVGVVGVEDPVGSSRASKGHSQLGRLSRVYITKE